MSNQNKNTFERVKKFAHDNKELLVIVANPVTDEIFIGFDDVNSFVKFPPVMRVVEGVLRAGSFEKNIDEFMAGIIRGMGDKKVEGVQFYKVIGGGVHAVGRERAKQRIAKAKEVAK